MQTLRRGLTGVLLLLLVAQALGPLAEAARIFNRVASTRSTCTCCRRADADDGCRTCRRQGAFRCGCGCQGQPDHAVTVRAFDPVAVLPDDLPGIDDRGVAPLAIPRAGAFTSFTPVPFPPPPWPACAIDSIFTRVSLERG